MTGPELKQEIEDAADVLGCPMTDIVEEAGLSKSALHKWGRGFPPRAESIVLVQDAIRVLAQKQIDRLAQYA